jgi:DNA gyrase subunit A
VLAKLYKLTDLRTNFNVNFVALVPDERGGAPQPQTLGLKEALEQYLRTSAPCSPGGRRSVGRRQPRGHTCSRVCSSPSTTSTRSSRSSAPRRAPTWPAGSSWSASTSPRSRPPRSSTCSCDGSHSSSPQDRRGARGAARAHRRARRDPRRPRSKLDALLATELKELKKAHGNPRRSRIAAQGESQADEALSDAPAPILEAQAVTVYVTAGGYLKSVPARRISAPHSHPRDPVVAVLRGTTDDTVLLIDAEGGGYRIGLADVPVSTMRQRGTTVAQLLGDGPDAPIAGAVLLDETLSDGADRLGERPGEAHRARRVRGADPGDDRRRGEGRRRDRRGGGVR